MPDGFLVLDKPLGWTSHDAVARIRRLTGERHIGHAGTLDPLATGVLPLALGRATRLVEYLSEASKTYEATVHFGVRTTTYDLEGEFLPPSGPVFLPDRATVEAALDRFRGPQQQVPPMHSAVWHEGQRLYELARAGREVERAPRAITIDRLDLLAWDPPRACLRVDCSKGTYIRSLAYDLGEALGCGAHLAALVRTRHGPFTLDRAVTPDGLATAVAAGTWTTDWLQPPDAAVAHLPARHVDAAGARGVLHGRMLAVPAPAPGEPALCRVYGPDGRLLAVMAWQPAVDCWQPLKVLAGSPDDSVERET